MEDLKKLPTAKLQSLLKKRGLSYSYRIKEDLVLRLFSALQDEGISEESEEEEQSEEAKESDQEKEELTQSHQVLETNEIGDKSVSQTNSFLLQDNPEKDKNAQQKLGISKGISNDNNLKQTHQEPETNKIEENLIDQTKSIQLKEGEGNNQKMSTEAEQNCSFLFRDVEESLETFNGETSGNISAWIKNFEDIATVCRWNHVQKYLYTRRLLRGAAKLVVEASSNIHSWKQLKDFLLKEFGEVASSLSIHRALENRKKSRQESYLEYMYSMKQIASKGNVDEESVIMYITAGIPDNVNNKILLYEAKTLDELKKKLKIYETVKSEAAKRFPKPEQKGTFEKGKNIQPKGRWINCGGKGHGNSNCPHKTKGARCFNCNEFGHIAPNCPLPKKSRNLAETSQVNTISTPELHVKVTINNKQYLALVDTGSDVSVMKETVQRDVKIPKDKSSSTYLTGFGQHLKKTLGSCSVIVGINGENYKVKCHVVPDLWLRQDIIIGKDLLKMATLTVTNGKAILKKAECLDIEEDSSNFLQSLDIIHLIQQNDMENVEEIQTSELYEKVKELISTYSPLKPTKSCVEMSISLHDETPVYQKARRLAPKEKQVVNQQIQEW